MVAKLQERFVVVTIHITCKHIDIVSGLKVYYDRLKFLGEDT